MLGVSITALSSIVWLFKYCDKKQSQHYLISCVCMTCVFLGLYFIPVREGHSVINLLYSFFESPGYLCIILSIFFIIKAVNDATLKMKVISEMAIKSTSIILLFMLGLIYFSSVLGLLWFNLYYVSAFDQAIIVVGLCLLIFILDKTFFIMILLSLVPFAFYNHENSTIIEFIICPYLWVFCGIKTIYITMQQLFKSIKKNRQDLHN